MGTSYVSELDVNRNSCIKQKVPLQAGRALLEFDYAGRKSTSAESQKFSVKLNGAPLVPPFQPSNDDRIQEDI